MTATEFAQTVAQLPADQQNAFLAKLKEVLTEYEYKTTASYISLFAMYHNPAKYNAMKNAVKAQLVEELFGHPYEKPENKGFDPCNPVYMTTIV